MPGIFHQPIDRRQFVAGVAKTVTALAAGVATTALGEQSPLSDKPVHLALLSDTHIPADPDYQNRKFRPVENLRRVVGQVKEVRPEAVILNGDFALLSGEVADYEAAKGLLTPLAEQIPIYIGLGNHDQREHFSTVFGKSSPAATRVPSKQVMVIERPQVRLILLDSLLYSNQVAGLLGKAQREWLARFLQDSDARPTVLFVHHTLGDGDTDLLDVERLFALLRPHPQVKAIFYGHSHAYSFRREHGLHLINLPAVGYNFADQEPVGWMEARFTAQGVELVLQAFGGNRAKDGEHTSLTWTSYSNERSR